MPASPDGHADHRPIRPAQGAPLDWPRPSPLDRRLRNSFTKDDTRISRRDAKGRGDAEKTKMFHVETQRAAESQRGCFQDSRFKIGIESTLPSSHGDSAWTS